VTVPPMPSRVPAGATPEGDGVVVGDGPVLVDAFIDFQCPYCRRFELASGPALASMVTDHRISIAYHPMNFLDQASTTRYSTRAAAAAGCAADQDRFLDYMHALFVNQPPEGSAGLSDAELAALGQSAGLTPGFADCVSRRRPRPSPSPSSRSARGSDPRIQGRWARPRTWPTASAHPAADPLWSAASRGHQQADQAGSTTLVMVR